MKETKTRKFVAHVSIETADEATFKEVKDRLLRVIREEEAKHDSNASVRVRSVEDVDG